MVVYWFHCHSTSLSAAGRVEKNSETKGEKVIRTTYWDQTESEIIHNSFTIKLLTFGSSLMLFASRNTSSSDRVYLITSSGTDCKLQCLRSIHSTCRLQARNIGMHLNMALIVHYGPFGNMWKSRFIPKYVKNMNICVLFRDLGAYIIGIRMLYIARDVRNYPIMRPSSAKGDNVDWSISSAVLLTQPSHNSDGQPEKCLTSELGQGVHLSHFFCKLISRNTNYVWLFVYCYSHCGRL